MANLWLAVVLLCLTMYVILDGYDLGIGTVMLLERRRDRRREMVEVVATTWDGNETWLILLGVALWGGFPQAYAVVLPHVYLPLITMLLALIARGVSIEMISAVEGTPRRWTGAFAVGSLLAAFAQGVVFGALTESVPLINGRYAGSALDVITPYPLLTGVAAVLLYATLGAGYLRLKSDGPLRNEASQRGRVLVGLTALMSIVVAILSGRTGAQLSAHTPWRTAGFFALVLLACVAAVVAAVGFSRPGGRDLG